MNVRYRTRAFFGAKLLLSYFISFLVASMHTRVHCVLIVLRLLSISRKVQINNTCRNNGEAKASSVRVHDLVELRARVDQEGESRNQSHRNRQARRRIMEGDEGQECEYQIPCLLINSPLSLLIILWSGSSSGCPPFIITTTNNTQRTPIL